MVAEPNPAKDAHPVRDDPVVTDLVTRAGHGDKQAWDALVARYAPLIWYICRRHRLAGADADGVGQSAWLQQIGQLDKVRDPAAPAGWLATTTRRECGRVLRAARGRACAGRWDPSGPAKRDGRAGAAGGRAPRGAARGVRALAPVLPAAARHAHRGPSRAVCPYQRQRGIPVASIGPNRSRCLDKLRLDPAIAALINATPKPRDLRCMARQRHSDDDQQTASWLSHTCEPHPMAAACSQEQSGAHRR
jgi:DNA-directed RNA polymerase specialized sigma24 family protein